MPDIPFPFWQGLRKRLIDGGNGTHREQVEAYPPVKLLTDGDGAYARLRVDPGQTSFWSGKEFRTFQEFSIPTGQMVSVRATVTGNIVLHSTSIDVDGSSVRMSLYTGGAAAGPWTAMPVIPKNTMTGTPVNVSNVTLDYDGTHTGGTRIDVVYASAGKTASVGTEEASERGVGPGTYYYRIENTGNQTASCIFKGWWENR